MFTKRSRNRRVLERTIEIAQGITIDPVLHQWCADRGYSWEDALAHERELKRFLVLAGSFPQRDYMARGIIGDLWRMFLLYTHLYQEFCDVVVGQYIHHHPPGTDRGYSYPRTYAAFYAHYEEAFGEKPPSEIWPDPVVGKPELAPPKMPTMLPVAVKA